MSSGPFIDAFYEMNSGDKAAIRVQPETASLVFGEATNTIPAGPATIPVRAKVSKTRREIGIGPRKVAIEIVNGEGSPFEDGSIISLPWFQADTWEALVLGATGTYQSAAVRLAFKTPESVK